MNELVKYLEAKNAKTQAWVDEDPENRYAGLITTDPTHWAEYGVSTVEQYKRYELESTIWDVYKDVHGIRPRGIDFSLMSMNELSEYLDDLCKVSA